MRRWLGTYLLLSVLCVFLGTLWIACGGGGDGGGGSSRALTGLAINGPASVIEYGTGTYTATATWDDNTTSTVTPTWSVNSQVASITPGGVLTCGTIDADQTVTVSATYTVGGVTETDTMNVALTNIATIPFTLQMLSGQAFFQEVSGPGSAYLSTLVVLNADFSLEQFETTTHLVSGGGEYLTGSWSLDASGNLIVDLGAQAPITVALISDSTTEIQVLIDDGLATPYIETLEKIVPVDPLKLPGTYVGNDGYTWVFTDNNTGSVSGFGGLTFTWTVDNTGVLRMPASTGYTAVLYGRVTSQSDNTSYTALKAAFTEFNTGTGAFYSYYGGIVLTRQ